MRQTNNSTGVPRARLTLCKAIKEFSKSRLKQQALQERQAKAFRERRRRLRPGQQRRQGDDMTDGPAMDFVYGGGADDIEKTLKDDPLFLIRKEIAVMKKLEYVRYPSFLMNPS